MNSREALFQGLKDNDTNAIQAILDSDQNAAAICDENGISFLMHALYHRKPQIAEMIRKKRTEITWFEASALGEVDQLKHFIETEPGLVNSYSNDGFTALHLAAFFNQPEAMKCLASRGANTNAISQNPMKLAAIHSATAGGDNACVSVLLEAGCDPNLKQEGGYTALMSAASRGNKSMVAMLLDSGADASLKDDKGFSARDHASRSGHEYLLESLG